MPEITLRTEEIRGLTYWVTDCSQCGSGLSKNATPGAADDFQAMHRRDHEKGMIRTVFGPLFEDEAVSALQLTGEQQALLERLSRRLTER